MVKLPTSIRVALATTVLDLSHAGELIANLRPTSAKALVRAYRRYHMALAVAAHGHHRSVEGSDAAWDISEWLGEQYFEMLAGGAQRRAVLEAEHAAYTARIEAEDEILAGAALPA